jgi:hypothetical protein
MPNWKSSFAVCLVLISPLVARGQVVQLPTVGSFNLSTSVAVPDSGSAALGGSMSGRSGFTSRGGLGAGVARGSSLGGGHVSVHATVIDLAELDSMIRSQSGKMTDQPKLHANAPRPQYSTKAKPRSKFHAAEYDYLMTLSRDGQVVESRDRDAVSYYLALAEQARLRGNWNSVELYYKMAWDHLPPTRREAALKDLAKARTPPPSKPSDPKRSLKPR